MALSLRSRLELLLDDAYSAQEEEAAGGSSSAAGQDAGGGKGAVTPLLLRTEFGPAEVAAMPSRVLLPWTVSRKGVMFTNKGDGCAYPFIHPFKSLESQALKSVI